MDVDTTTIVDSSMKTDYSHTSLLEGGVGTAVQYIMGALYPRESLY